MKFEYVLKIIYFTNFGDRVQCTAAAFKCRVTNKMVFIDDGELKLGLRINF